MEPTDRKARFAHRRARLAELLKALEPAPRAWFAAAIQRSESYVARLLLPEGDEHRKNIGDAIMAAATSELRLDPGWFDLPLGTAIPEGVRLDEKGNVSFDRHRGPARQSRQIATVERVTEITLLPAPFDHDRFGQLPEEQRQDIAQVAALMVDAFSRYNPPPEKGGRSWGKGSRSVEAQELQPRKRPATKKRVG